MHCMSLQILYDENLGQFDCCAACAHSAWVPVLLNVSHLSVTSIYDVCVCVCVVVNPLQRYIHIRQCSFLSLYLVAC